MRLGFCRIRRITEQMQENLVIVESPSKTKPIEKYLGSGYKVLSSKGHIRDLSTKGKYGFGVDSVREGELYQINSFNFPMEKVVLHGNNKTEEELY